MSKTQYILSAFVLAILILGVWSLAKAAPIITTGMEVIGTQKIGILTLSKVLDHDNGAVCYVYGSSISCLSQSILISIKK